MVNFIKHLEYVINRVNTGSKVFKCHVIILSLILSLISLSHPSIVLGFWLFPQESLFSYIFWWIYNPLSLRVSLKQSIYLLFGLPAALFLSSLNWRVSFELLLSPILSKWSAHFILLLSVMSLICGFCIFWYSSLLLCSL